MIILEREKLIKIKSYFCVRCQETNRARGLSARAPHLLDKTI
ncbi:MAG: hypothetical protein ACOZBL_04960 [Patescibacteria group bacterium]